MGVSVLFMTLLFLLTIILVVFIVLCCNYRDISLKNRQRIKTLKQKFKYNPMIRYALLNALNLNWITLCVFMHEKSKMESKVVAALISILINICCPLLLAKFLHLKGKELEEEETVA